MKTMVRIKEFDVIRALSALIVVIYHFSCLNREYGFWIDYPLMYKSGSVYWGGMAVTMFWVLSGCVLFHQYNDISCLNDLKIYYYKRWKSIFPLYYIVFLFYFVQRVLVERCIFYQGSISKIILSILGIDGYFSYISPNYYQVGEWFLGGMLIVYLIYPLILKLFNKHTTLTLILAICLAVGCYFIDFKIMISRNLIVILAQIIIGMYIMKHKERVYKNGKYTWIALTFFIIMMCVEKINFALAEIVAGISCFIILFNVSGWFQSNTIFRKGVSYISNISFGIFLVQHKIIYWTAGLYADTRLDWKNQTLLLCVDIVIILLMASGFTIISQHISNNENIKKIEKKYIYNK